MSVRPTFYLHFIYFLYIYIPAKYGDSFKDQKVKKGTWSFGKPGKRGKDFVCLLGELYCIFWNCQSCRWAVSWREEQYRSVHTLVFNNEANAELWLCNLTSLPCALDAYERDLQSTWCKETETAKRMAQQFKVSRKCKNVHQLHTFLNLCNIF